MEKQLNGEQRNYYQKHKAKLQEIKHHNTSLQFYNSGPNRPDDRKKILNMKIRREEIETQNKKLRDKIQKYNKVNAHTQPVSGGRNKIVSESQGYYRGTLKNQKNKRYGNREQEEDVIEVNSDCQGDNMKCIIPTNAHAKRKYMFSLQKEQYGAIAGEAVKRSSQSSVKKLPQLKKQFKIQQMSENQEKYMNENNSKNIFDQNNKNVKILKNIVKGSIKNEGDNYLYQQPEKQAHRIVLYKKTKILQPMVCYVIQVSLIGKQLLIVASGMGLQTKDHTLLVEKKKSKELLDWSEGEYDRIWHRVSITNGGLKILQDVNQVENNGDSIKNLNQLMDIENRRANTQRLRKLQITQQFLQRNYYVIKEEQSNSKDNSNKEHKKMNESKGSFLRAKIESHREIAKVSTQKNSTQKDHITKQENKEKTVRNQLKLAENNLQQEYMMGESMYDNLEKSHQNNSKVDEYLEDQFEGQSSIHKNELDNKKYNEQNSSYESQLQQPQQQQNQQQQNKGQVNEQNKEQQEQNKEQEEQNKEQEEQNKQYQQENYEKQEQFEEFQGKEIEDDYEIEFQQNKSSLPNNSSHLKQLNNERKENSIDNLNEEIISEEKKQEEDLSEQYENEHFD